MIPVTKDVVNYQVISPDGILLQEVSSITIKESTDKSYVCDLYAGNERVASDRRFTFDEIICEPLSVGENGLAAGDFPTAEWTDEEIKMYLDHHAIEYLDETGLQLIALIPNGDE